MTACTSAHFSTEWKRQMVSSTHMYLSEHGKQPVSELEKKSKSDTQLPSPQKEGQHSQSCALGSKSTIKNFVIQLFISSGSRHEDMYSKGITYDQLSLKNLTDYLFQQICCFLLAFQLRKNNNDLKDRKSSIFWKIHYLAVYIFSNNTDVSVYYVFFIVFYNPRMQYTCKLFTHNYYVASVMVCTTKMTGF